MEDVLTDAPPPSRFFQEDLDNFATPSPSLPPPFLRLDPNPSNPNLLHPSILIVAISAPSLSLIRRIPNKTLIGTLNLPETPPSPKSCNIYAVDGPLSPSIVVAVRHAVSPERSRAVAKALLGEIRADRVLIFDSIKAENYRSRLSSDEAVGFKLETTAERRGGDHLVRDWEYFPTGSVMGGLVSDDARRATLCVTWPENGWSSAAMLLRPVMKDLGLDVDGDEIRGDEETRVPSRSHSEMYI
ncbi:hypothetical protein KSP40_PGU022754 [Platanthera guangdongensis]|uniref:Uncharacterized protein n=1 Tax=Platanthera guangdongensis TaxID=2320717 RepID=A0ABR2N1I8_9ASPA